MALIGCAYCALQRSRNFVRLSNRKIKTSDATLKADTRFVKRVFIFKLTLRRKRKRLKSEA